MFNLFKEDLKDIDVRIAKKLAMLIFENRIKIYILVILYLFVFVLSKVPYVNLYTELINFLRWTFLYVLVILVFGFKEIKLYLVSISLFVILSLLVLVNKDSTAEQLGVVVYMLLITAVVKSVQTSLQEK
ncbi:MAG: hypothetical protein A3C27_01695 [Candidatus Levybacteria bacterium RIFCSPHIGHO2_02_FULL_39_36]|nr:MAG: hypothetical protein UT20_C0011G0014 [Candidatus Levybacteria bacterium GW2011_GWA1_39_11]KKR25036.1 MAG: hypothetical protein UT56_C0004G0015 [Candidatus Levybacteria bacterium GW2011_GWB1_39_7]KKR26962.1 MAG: hypothetical protein UT57_C0023G0007 [Microgenomates group bacterium GW2011_GWC1_39_7]OGH15374.1 MAG: hypothetical protein A2689_02180 [Candidatus Levybacteria bacterium RIFCSPHIGHO2_01_FULL_38_96]OGH27579.1 MAG: hypothetical protein A3C27_01695 [Candidatus Levybacteria bacterium